MAIEPDWLSGPEEPSIDRCENPGQVKTDCPPHPRLIHYCWFGEKKIDRFAKNCIRSWRRYLPGYEIKCWDNESLKQIKSTFVQQAIADRRWAFVADYVRLYALYHEGGVYFDTDVKLYHDVSEIMREGEVVIPTQTSISTGYNLMCAVIAAVPGHPFIKKCLDYYANLTYDPENFRKVIINPIMSRILHDGWDYRYENICQKLPDGIIILDRTYFESSFDITDRKYSKFLGVHFCNQSWVPHKRGAIYTFCKSNDLMGLYNYMFKCISALRHLKKALRLRDVAHNR